MLKKWSSDECDIYFIDLLGGEKWVYVYKHVCLIFNLRF